MNRPMPDRAEIERAINILFNPDAVVEVRIPKTRAGTVSGYFNDHRAMAAAIQQADAKYQASGIITRSTKWIRRCWAELVIV